MWIRIRFFLFSYENPDPHRSDANLEHNMQGSTTPGWGSFVSLRGSLLRWASTIPGWASTASCELPRLQERLHGSIVSLLPDEHPWLYCEPPQLTAWASRLIKARSCSKTTCSDYLAILGNPIPCTVEELNCKRPIGFSFKIDLLTDIATLCLTDFLDWRYIYSLVGIFDPACELLPTWTKELYLFTVAPQSSLWPPPPFPN